MVNLPDASSPGGSAQRDEWRGNTGARAFDADWETRTKKRTSAAMPRAAHREALARGVAVMLG